MNQSNRRFLWCILLLYQMTFVRLAPRKVVMPDSTEMYAYKEPRSMNDLQMQHMRQAMNDVSDTISEVQRILRRDPSLPRLTRGEIEDLFEMVAREEYKRSLEAGDFERAKHMRSLMLVLPYNTNMQSEERLEDLYTRAPVTQMIGNELKRPRPQQLPIPVSAENTIDVNKAASLFAQHHVSTTFKPNYVTTNIQTTYAAPVVTAYHPKLSPQMQMQMYRRNENSINQEAAYRSKVGPSIVLPTYQTTKLVPQSAALTSQPKLTEPRTAQTSAFSVNTDATMRPNVKHLLATIGLQPDTSSTQSRPRQSAFNDLSTAASTYPVMSTVSTQQTAAATATTTTTTTTVKPELTPELKELLESFGFLSNDVPAAPTQAATAVTLDDEEQPLYHSLNDDSLSVSEFRPLPTSVTRSDIKERIGGSYEIRSDDFASFKRLPAAEDTPVSPDDEFDDLLKMYGLYETDATRDMKSIDDTEKNEKQITDRSDVSTTAQAHVESENQLSKVPEVDVAFLTPDLTRLLGTMGVKQIKANGENVSKKESAVKSEEKSVKSKRITTTTTTTTTTSTTEAPRPVYTPTVETLTLSPGNEIQNLHYLLDTIRQLESLNKNEATNSSKSTDDTHPSNKKQNHLADPLEDYYVNDNRIKNEVKRQLNASEPTKITLDLPASTPITAEDSNNDENDDVEKIEITENITGASTDEPSVETEPKTREGKKEDDSLAVESVVSSTTEQTKNGDLRDLADSFGGSDGLDPMPDESLPPPRKNGFYFFSDWNSFLEVGEEPDKVVVRFDPKIGDSSQFVPVKIP